MRRGVTLLAAIAALTALGACGGDDAPADQGIGGNKPLQLVACHDWNNASSSERLYTLKQIRDFAGGPVGEPAGRGAIVDDDDAYDLFERYCASDFADAFKLYKLYVRYAAFAGH